MKDAAWIGKMNAEQSAIEDRYTWDEADIKVKSLVYLSLGKKHAETTINVTPTH